MHKFLLLLATFLALAVFGLNAQTPTPHKWPYEVVHGFYYFTDQGLYREASTPSRKPVFSEKLVPQGGLDFGNKLVFTFDDVVFGPYLDSLLQLLAQYHIHAVFFLTATHMGSTDHATITKYLKRIIADGHELGNHSYSHDVLDRGHYAPGKDAFEATKAEFTKLEDVVDRRLGYHYPMQYLRPPFGIRGNDGKNLGERMSIPGRVDEVCKVLGRTLVEWHINSIDFLLSYNLRSPEYRDPDQVITECLKRIHASKGGVILFHANPRTPRILAGVLKGLWGKEQNAYQAVTLADLLKIKYGTP